MKTVKIPVKGMSVGELIDSVMAGGEYYDSDGMVLKWHDKYGMTLNSIGDNNQWNCHPNLLKRDLDDGKIYQIKTSEDYVAELLNDWMCAKPYSRLEGSKMIVKFLESEGFLTLPEGEV